METLSRINDLPFKFLLVSPNTVEIDIQGEKIFLNKTSPNCYVFYQNKFMPGGTETYKDQILSFTFKHHHKMDSEFVDLIIGLIHNIIKQELL